jgi:hypothetical protein
VSSTSQYTDFSDLYLGLQHRVRVTTGTTATTEQAKNYINIALHDFNLGFQYKLPWLERQGQLRTHTPYSDGTVAISVGSTTLTGTSTLWNTANSYNENNARTSGKLVLQGTTDIYPIATVTSDTSITLGSRYVGSAALSGATYTYFEDTYDLASDFLRPMDFQLFSEARGIKLIPRDEFRRRFPRPNVAGNPEYACLLDMAPNGSTSPIRRVQFYPYPSTITKHIPNVKELARQKILAYIPDWKQSNLIARQSELNMQRFSLPWTVAEENEIATLSAMWNHVKAIRRASDVHELALNAMTDFADLAAYDITLGWPE